ncbi:MAG: hypothetical protein WC295_01205 [Methanoregula sp.]|jgi:hypothetical protein
MTIFRVPGFICSTPERYNTIAGCTAGVAAIMASAPLATAHTGTIIHDHEIDGHSATLRCHDPNGEMYSMDFPCDRLNVTSHSADAILAKVDPGQTRSLPSRKVMGMDNEILITAAFLGAGLIPCLRSWQDIHDLKRH